MAGASRHARARAGAGLAQTGLGAELRHLSAWPYGSHLPPRCRRALTAFAVPVQRRMIHAGAHPAGGTRRQQRRQRRSQIPQNGRLRAWEVTQPISLSMPEDLMRDRGCIGVHPDRHHLRCVSCNHSAADPGHSHHLLLPGNPCWRLPYEAMLRRRTARRSWCRCRSPPSAAIIFDPCC